MMIESISIILFFLIVFLLCLLLSYVDYELHHNFKEHGKLITEMENNGYPREVIAEISRVMREYSNKRKNE